MPWFLLNLHTVSFQPAPDGRLTEYYTRCRGSFSTCTPFLFNLHTGRSFNRILYQMLWFLLNRHTGRSLTQNTIPDAVVPSQPTHRFFSTCTPDGHLHRILYICFGSFSTCTPDGHLHRILYQMLWFLLNLYTGRSLN